MNSRIAILIFTVFPLLFSVESEYLEYDETVSLLDYFRQYPLNINTATEAGIYELPHISEQAAELIYIRIRDKGVISSLKTLSDEGLLSADEAETLKDCVIFTEGKRDIRAGYYSLRFTRRIEESVAYADSVYLGNRSRFNHKIGLFSKNVSMNAIIEKEPGEIYYTDNMKGNIIISDDSYRVILGDFNLNSATGMLQKEGFVFDRYALSFSKDHHDFTRPSPSSNDYSGYKGAAAYYTFYGTRITAFKGFKDLSASLNEDGSVKSVNLYAYTRTLTEIGRYHNTVHEVTGAGIGGYDLGIRYAASVTREEFNRETGPDADLREGTAAELSLQKSAGDWDLRADAATDLDRYNLKFAARFKNRELSAGFLYGYMQKDKFCLTSPGMFYGGGDEEHVWGFRMKIRIAQNMIFISDNIFYSAIKDGAAYPGSVYSAKTNLKLKDVTLEPNFIYKYSESVNSDFVTAEKEEYQAKLKAKYGTETIAATSYLSYTDKGGGAFGYIIGSGITAGRRSFKVRTGADIYQTKNGCLVYSAIADIGRYASLTSFSGTGMRSYIMLLYKGQTFEISAGMSRRKRTDSETSGSGYDLIGSDTVHDAEINFRLNL